MRVYLLTGTSVTLVKLDQNKIDWFTQVTLRPIGDSLRLQTLVGTAYMRFSLDYIIYEGVYD